MNRITPGMPRRAVVCGFAALLLTGSGLLGVGDASCRELVRAGMAPAPGVVASFRLLDQHGQPVTSEDFRGSFMLVFFGYTYCPDVCPLGLQRMSQAVEALGPDGERIVPIFITVDPERDTGDVLAAYTAHFHPRLVGLTGTLEQIDAAEKAYGVRSFKVFLPPSFDDEESDDDDNSRYLMQHSASTYLVGPDGVLESVFPHEMPAREMARQLERLVTGDH